MDPVITCGEQYHRDFGGGLRQTLVCTYAKDHVSHIEQLSHSWDDIRMADNRAKAATAERPVERTAFRAAVVVLPETPDPKPDAVASVVADFVEAIEAGEYDPYLEMLLAAGHDRKRALRGVRGFRRRDRD